MDYNTLVQELYQLRKDHGINPTLEYIKKILTLFDNPQKNFKSIHIVGTNGKGSVCAMLSNILSKAGLKVGRYTSPHLVDVRERIVINDQMISKEDFMRLVLLIQEKKKSVGITLTFFEIMTTLCFLYFSEQKVDYAIIEAGLGGTWDATNVILPKICVITSISIDHTEYLGNTVEEITKDKCGIIKPGSLVVTKKDQPCMSIIKEKIKEESGKLLLSTPYLGANGLAGDFQKENAGIAYTVAQFLNIPHAIIQEGIATTTWPGRCQFIEKNILVDGAHNLGGIKALAQYVNSIRSQYTNLTILFGVGKKKQWREMIAALPDHDLLIVTQSTNEEALDPGEIGEGMIIPDFKEALESAKKLTPQGLIVICGSLYLIGDVMHVLDYR